MRSTTTKYYNADFAARFPGTKGIRFDSFTRMVAIPARTTAAAASPANDHPPTGVDHEPH